MIHAGGGLLLQFEISLLKKLVKVGARVVSQGLYLNDLELDVVLLAYFQRPFPDIEVCRSIGNQMNNEVEAVQVDYSELEFVAANH